MKPSRAMLTGELSWAFVAVCVAWAGSGLWPMEGTHLHSILYTWKYDYLWTGLIGIPALALLWVSAKEHFLCHNQPNFWDLGKINASASLRGRLCLMLAFTWAYILYVMVNVVAEYSTLTLVSLGGVVFCLWFWTENRRVQRDFRKHSAIPASSAS